MIFEWEINANKNCYIVKIRTTEGYKVGLSRDFGTGISMEEQEYVELLEDKKYTDEEAEERIKYWCKKLNLEDFKIFEHEIDERV